MATPFVSGSIGLLLAADATATPADAAAALEATAGLDATNWTAFGVIHLDRALASILDIGTPYPVLDSRALAATTGPAPEGAVHAGGRDPLGLAVVGAEGVLGIRGGRFRAHQPVEPTARLPGSHPAARQDPRLGWGDALGPGALGLRLRTAVYTLTVTRPGSHSAKETVGFT